MNPEVTSDDITNTQANAFEDFDLVDDPDSPVPVDDALGDAIQLDHLADVVVPGPEDEDLDAA